MKSMRRPGIHDHQVPAGICLSFFVHNLCRDLIGGKEKNNSFIELKVIFADY
jgi:hypothetical protein